MSDETNTQNTTPAPAQKTATTELASKAWGEFKGGIVALFGPVASLITARTLWTAGAIVVLGFWLGWTDVKAFGLSALWTLVGVSMAYIARKFLVPEVKAKEFYDLSKAGNIAAAVVTLRLALVEAACILVVALGALKAGV